MTDTKIIINEIKKFSIHVRKKILTMAFNAGASSAHLGGALSISEIISVLFSYKMKIKKGTQVKIVCGKDKGKSGEILEIDRRNERVKINSINMIKKHTKPTKENKGGIISKENFIHLSNIKNLDIEKKTKTINKKWYQD